MSLTGTHQDLSGGSYIFSKLNLFHSEAGFKDKNGSDATFYPCLQQLHIKHNRLMLHLSVVFCVVLYIQPEEFLKPLVFSHIVGSFRSKLFWTKPDPEGFFVTNCIFQISPSLNNEQSHTYEYCLAVLWKIIKYMMLKLTLDFP